MRKKIANIYSKKLTLWAVYISLDTTLILSADKCEKNHIKN